MRETLPPTPALHPKHRPVLSRAKCPWCGYVITAMSWDARERAKDEHLRAGHCGPASGAPRVPASA
jgi:hypothetical protein